MTWIGVKISLGHAAGEWASRHGENVHSRLRTFIWQTDLPAWVMPSCERFAPAVNYPRVYNGIVGSDFCFALVPFARESSAFRAKSARCVLTAGQAGFEGASSKYIFDRGPRGTKGPLRATSIKRLPLQGNNKPARSYFLPAPAPVARLPAPFSGNFSRRYFIGDRGRRWLWKCE